MHAHLAGRGLAVRAPPEAPQVCAGRPVAPLRIPGASARSCRKGLPASSQAGLAERGVSATQSEEREVAAAPRANGSCHNPLQARAVVIGAGIAGLATARVLTDFFEEVVVLERDGQEDGAQRGGVPQFNQPHAMLNRGLEIVEGLFPGFRDDLISQGAQPLDFLKDQRTFDYGRYAARLPKEEWSPTSNGVGATRALYEATLRKRTMELPKVRLRPHSWASDMVLTPDNTAVTGVRLKSGEVLEAGFVVDTSGRASHLPEWLQRAGYAAPKEERIGSGLGYGSRTYAMPPGFQESRDWKVLLFSCRPAAGRQAIILPVEGGRFQVVLWGPGGDLPPRDEAGYMAFAESMQMPELVQALRDATPLTPVRQYTRTENTRRHYEKVDMPAGLAVLGDATCAFNPIHGQGMTVGMLSAAALSEHLASAWPALAAAGTDAERAAVLKGVCKAFQAKLAQLQDFPWSVATLDDLQQLANRGANQLDAKSPREKFVLWYFGMVVRVATEDWNVNRKLAPVMHMLTPPHTLFHPRVFVKVLLLWLREVLGSKAATLARPTPATS